MNKEKVFAGFLLVFALALFFPFRLPTLVMIAACGLMLGWSNRGDWRNLGRKLGMIHWGLISFFLVCLITALVHEKPGDAWKLIETRLALFFLPVALALQEDAIMQRALIKRVTWGFIIGSLIFTGYNFIIAVIHSTHLGEGGWHFDAAVVEGKEFFESISYGGNYFFSIHLSPNLHPTYASIYIITCLLLLWFAARANKAMRLTDIFISLWLVVNLFVLSSRGAILSFILLVLFVVGWYAVSGTSRRLKVWLVIVAVLALAVIVLNPRIGMMMDSAELTEHNPRYYIWQVAWGLLPHSCWGLGFNGLTEALLQGYKEMDYHQGLTNQYNVHNQYMETLLTSGVLGLASLLFFLFAFFRQGVRLGSPLIIGLAIVIGVNLLFESLLNRFSGIAFVSFLFPLLSQQPKPPVVKTGG